MLPQNDKESEQVDKARDFFWPKRKWLSAESDKCRWVSFRHAQKVIVGFENIVVFFEKVGSTLEKSKRITLRSNSPVKFEQFRL